MGLNEKLITFVNSCKRLRCESSIQPLILHVYICSCWYVLVVIKIKEPKLILINLITRLLFVYRCKPLCITGVFQPDYLRCLLVV